MPRRRKPNKLVLALIAVLHLTAVAVTWRDIRTRSATQVRGPKPLWRAASAMNTLGSAAYWVFGRRRRTG